MQMRESNVKTAIGESIPGTDLVLEEKVASTRMSTVFRARSSTLGRDFCAKFVPNSSDSQRWRQEVAVLSTLNSPHVVKLFRTIDLGDQSVLVLDWAPGSNLGEFVATNGPLAPQDALEVTRQLSLALVAVHALGVVHRDLKPANVMVDRLPSGDLFVSLLDFGISKVVSHANVSTGFVGSPLYAAPEQIAENPVDERTDIYQLGCVLYFMLTGAPPFNAADAPTVMNSHLYQPPSRVSSAIPRLRRWGLDDLVLDMLAKSPDNRPSSAEELLSLLDGATHEHAGETNPLGLAELSVVGPDRSVVTASESHIVVRRDAEESHFEMPGVKVTALHAAPGVVYFGTAKGSIKRLTVSVGSVDEIVQLPRMRPVNTVTATANRLIAADDSGRVFIVNVDSGSYKVVHADGVAPLIISGAEQTEHFAVVDTHGMLTIYDGAIELVRTNIEIKVRHLAMSPDGYVVAAFGDGVTLVVNAMNGSVMHRVDVKQPLHAITFVGGTLIGIGQTHDGTETFDLFG